MLYSFSLAHDANNLVSNKEPFLNGKVFNNLSGLLFIPKILNDGLTTTIIFSLSIPKKRGLDSLILPSSLTNKSFMLSILINIIKDILRQVIYLQPHNIHSKSQVSPTRPYNPHRLLHSPTPLHRIHQRIHQMKWNHHIHSSEVIRILKYRSLPYQHYHQYT